MFGIKKLLYGNSLGLSREALAKLTTPPPNTPDVAELHDRKHNLVLLYGNEMSGGRANNLDVKPIYKEVFTHDPFVMANVKKGELVAPVVFNPPRCIMSTKSLKIYAAESVKQAHTMSRIARLRPAPIQGELYQLTGDEVEQLDKVYENTVLFDRIRVRVQIEHYGQYMKKVGNSLEDRITERMLYEKRVHMYVGRYAAFSNMTILNRSLLKERPNNYNYAPRYFYTRQDGK